MCRYNKVLESLIGENVLDYKEETFNIFESKSEKDDSVLEFDDYVDADIDSNSKATDEDNFEINGVD